MKKYLIILIFLCIGCSSKTILTCTYIDQTSIYGTKTTIDTLTFKNEKLTAYQRNINFTLENEMTKNINNIYKSMKQETKTFKKYIGGKYKMNKRTNQINLTINIKKVKTNDFSYIKINTNDYSTTKKSYESLGFTCE